MDDPSPSLEGDEVRQPVDFNRELREQLRPAFLGLFILTLLTGVVFPLLLSAIAFPLFAHQAKGGLVTRNGVVVGAELIGQIFSGPAYFHPRPSAAGAGYDALASGGTNLGPANPKLINGASPADAGTDKPFVGIRQLAEAYRRLNGLSADTPIPIDGVTRSGSGLDPHISPANAELQVARVARERQLSPGVIRRLVAQHTLGRQFGFLGQPRVAVLALNLDLDRLSARSSTSR